MKIQRTCQDLPIPSKHRPTMHEFLKGLKGGTVVGSDNIPDLTAVKVLGQDKIMYLSSGNIVDIADTHFIYYLLPVAVLVTGESS